MPMACLYGLFFLFPVELYEQILDAIEGDELEIRDFEFLGDTRFGGDENAGESEFREFGNSFLDAGDILDRSGEGYFSDKSRFVIDDRTRR